MDRLFDPNYKGSTKKTICYFEFWKNTKFVDMQNTLHFDSNEERDKWFSLLGQGDKENFITSEVPFNFRRDRGNVRVPITMDELQGFNYGRFLNGWDKRIYYFFIGGMSYLNDNTTQVEIVIDVVMTYTQGNVLQNLAGIDVKRQHLTSDTRDYLMENLRSNDDVLPVNTLKYVKSREAIFKKFKVIVESSVSLDESTWGSDDSPKMKTSGGMHINYDVGMSDLYVYDETEWSNFTTKLKDYPWIAQNIKSATIVPADMLNGIPIDENNAINMSGNQDKNDFIDFNSFLSLDIDKLRKWVGIKSDGSEDYLIRDNLMTFELTDYRNHTVPIKPSNVDLTEGIVIGSKQNVGYNNVIEIYHARDDARRADDGLWYSHGNWLNNVLRLDNFDNAPLMIDNGKLAKANSAYSRANTNQDTFSGRINRIMDGSNSTNDRVMSAFSIYSDVFSGGLLGSVAKGAGLFKDEYNYYRDQKAQFKQWGITPPTVTDGSYNNSILKMANAYGVFLNVSVASKADMDKMRRYYGDYGFDTNGISTQLDDINSMTICNWVQFDGHWTIPNVDSNFVIQLQSIFSAGVRLFHNYDSMLTYDPKDNKIKQ